VLRGSPAHAPGWREAPCTARAVLWTSTDVSGYLNHGLCAASRGDAPCLVGVLRSIGLRGPE